MTDEKLREDINWMKQMAEEGKKSSVVGGIIGIWWGLISFVMMLLQWAVLTGRLNFPIENIGWVWLAYVMVGSAGTMALVNRLQQKPGFKSVNSQIAGTVWMLASAGVFTFAIGCIVAAAYGAPTWIFNAILPVALICYGIANGVVAHISGNRLSIYAAISSFAFALMLFPFLPSPTIYLIAAFAILIVAVMSSFSQGKIR